MKIRKDHVLHFSVCFFLMIPFLIIAQFVPIFALIGAIITLGIGVWKEIHDIKTTGFDWTDILADLAGLGTALLLFLLMMIGG